MMILDPDRSKPRARRRRILVKGMHQDLSSYIGFGLYSISCLAIFVLVYSVALFVLVPLLSDSVSLEESLKDSPGVLEAAGKLRRQWNRWRDLAGVTDETLLQETIREFEARKEFLRHVH